MNHLIGTFLILLLPFLTKSQPLSCTAVKQPRDDAGICNAAKTGITDSERCCWINYKLGKDILQFCKVIGYTPEAIGAVRKEYKSKQYEDIDIQCSSSYLVASVLLVIALLF